MVFLLGQLYSHLPSWRNPVPSLSDINFESLDEKGLTHVQQALSYLSSRKNPELEGTFAKKLTFENLTPIVSHLLLKAPDLLETCFKVTTLDLTKSFGVENVTERPKDEACFMPKPQTASLASKISSRITLAPGIFGKIFNYAVSIFTQTYNIDLESPPNDYMSAQNQWMFFHSLVSDVRWIGTFLLAYFVTLKKTAAAGFAILGAMLGVKHLYHRFGFNKVAQFNTTYFEELTGKENTETVGRFEELQELISCICVPPGSKPVIPILIGPPGAGKTELVKMLSKKIASGETPQLQGMHVHMVDSASLTQYGGWSQNGRYFTRLDQIIQQLQKGKEKYAIMFFDEFHNVASGEGAAVGGKGMLLETFKTKFSDKGILCILATTEEEYKKLILPNEAFVDRIRLIRIDPLTRQLTKELLQKQFLGSTQSGIAVDREAIDEVLKIADNHPDFKERAYPRKAIQILELAIHTVYSTAFSQKTDQEMTLLEGEISTLQIELQELHAESPVWTKEGKEKLAELKGKQKKLEELKIKKTALSTLHRSLFDLQELQRTYRQRNYTLIHSHADSTLSKEEEKSLLWIEFIVLPALKKLIDNTVKRFKDDYQEEPLTKVTAELIQRLFPEKKIPVSV